MKRLLLLGTLMVFATGQVAGSGLALAQNAAHPADTTNPVPDSPADGGAGVRSGNITSSGETVPNPGASQSAGTTSLDRGIQQEDTKIQSSICKGC